MDTIEKIKAAWSQIDEAPRPASFVQYIDAFNAAFKMREHKLRAWSLLEDLEGAHILDVGCGTGDDARLLAQQVGATGKVVGVDPSLTMLQEARKRCADQHLAVEFKQGSVYDLPFETDSFDGCYSFFAFDLLEHPYQALLELIRVTRPGRQIVVSAPDYETFVVNASRRDLTRKILNLFCDLAYSGWIGRQLTGLYVRAGLQDIGAIPDTFVFRSPDYLLMKQLYFQGMASRALSHGIVSAAEADEWLRSLDETHRSGEFFGSTTFFIVSGRKP